MTTEDISAVLRELTGQLSAARSDIATLLEMHRDSAENRVAVSKDLHRIDVRLSLVESAVSSIMARQSADAPSMKRLGIVLAGLSAAALVVGAIIPNLILDWWRSQ